MTLYGRARTLVAITFFLFALPLIAQTTDPQEKPKPVEAEPPTTTEVKVPDPLPEPTEQAAPAQQPAAAPGETTATPEPRDNFPNMNIYLPEGEFDVRVRKLIRNVLFEGQVNYEFADGDVSTFLRYKYYARNFTYRIGVFDTIEFGAVEKADLDFDRVRGGLLLFEYPVNYNRRYFTTLQADNLSFGDTAVADNNKTNVFIKLGYQFGTPFDERLNSIVGETRGRIATVLTAYREIGPQKMGLGVAVTQGLDSVGGDFDYTKLEAEGLKRFDFGNVSFLISRLHLGSFLQKKRLPEFANRPLFEQFSVPRYEQFRLGGRDSLKGVDDQAARGLDEIHLSNEFFYPVFRNKDYRKLGATFTNLFAIGYLGSGTAGFIGEDDDEPVQFGDVVVDGGVGFETSFFIRDYEVFLSAVWAQTLTAPTALEGDEFRVSVRTSR